MRYSTIFLCFVAVLLLAACSGPAPIIKQAADGMTFEESWDSHCADYNFDDWSSVNSTTTMGDMYNGSSFYSDVQNMDYLVDIDLGRVYEMRNIEPSLLSIWYDDGGEIYE